jgi:hypothetical protein
VVLRALARLGCVGLPLLWAGLAGAAEAAVELERPPKTTCVSEQDLAAALSRAGLGVRTDPSAGERVRVAVSGTPAVLVVTLRRDGSETVEHLAPATCETATDVVAAFVTSTLAPAPVVSVPDQRRVPLAALEKALGDELARRRIQFAKLGVSFALERDGSGPEISAELVANHARDCDRNLSLGPIRELSGAAVAGAADAVERALAAQKRCIEQVHRAAAATAKAEAARIVPGREPARKRALRDALDEADTSADVDLGFAILATSLGLAWFAIDGLGSERSLGFSNPKEALLTVSAATLTVGGSVSIAAPEDYRRSAVLATIYAGIGFYWGGTLWNEVPRGTAIAPVLGHLMTAELLVADAALRRRPLSRVRRARDEMERSWPSRERVVAVERDLEGLETTIPRWVIFTPVMVGGVVTAISPLLGESNPKDTASPILIGLQSWALGLAGAAAPSIHDGYTKDLRKAGLEELSFGPGPGDLGLSVLGKF